MMENNDIHIVDQEAMKDLNNVIVGKRYVGFQIGPFFYLLRRSDPDEGRFVFYHKPKNQSKYAVMELLVQHEASHVIINPVKKTYRHTRFKPPVTFIDQMFEIRAIDLEHVSAQETALVALPTYYLNVDSIKEVFEATRPFYEKYIKQKSTPIYIYLVSASNYYLQALQNAAVTYPPTCIIPLDEDNEESQEIFFDIVKDATIPFKFIAIKKDTNAWAKISKRAIENVEWID